MKKKLYSFKSRLAFHIVDNWYAYVMLIMTYTFSFVVLLKPEIYGHLPKELSGYFIEKLFEPVITAFCLCLFSTLKLIGKLYNLRRVRLYSLIILSSIWSATSIVLLYRFIQGLTAAGFLFALTMFLICVGQALRGNYGHL